MRESFKQLADAYVGLLDEALEEFNEPGLYPNIDTEEFLYLGGIVDSFYDEDDEMSNEDIIIGVLSELSVRTLKEVKFARDIVHYIHDEEPVLFKNLHLKSSGFIEDLYALS